MPWGPAGLTRMESRVTVGPRVPRGKGADPEQSRNGGKLSVWKSKETLGEKD